MRPSSVLNTGTVVGVFCNLFGGSYQPRRIPSFAWGSIDRFSEYRLEKAFEVAQAVMTRRHKTRTDAERALLTTISEARTVTR